MLYDMWLLSLEQLQALYGGERPTYQNVDVFQKFKAQNELTNWNDLPYDSNIIFISHEWCGWKHADPHGVQIRCFLRMFWSVMLECEHLFPNTHTHTQYSSFLQLTQTTLLQQTNKQTHTHTHTQTNNIFQIHSKNLKREAFNKFEQTNKSFGRTR
jgi:hypothetical protein